MQEPKKRGKASGTRWTSPDKEWLEYQYVALRKSAGQIANEVGADGNTVRKWLYALCPEYDGYESWATARARMSGEEHPAWDEYGSDVHHARIARKLMQSAGTPKVCFRCGSLKSKAEIHHLDGNVENNTLKNLVWLCRSCHMLAHYNPRQVNEELQLLRQEFGNEGQIKVRALRRALGDLWPHPGVRDSWCFLLLEVSEVGDALLRKGFGEKEYVRHHDKEASLFQELADAYIMLCTLASNLGIDLDASLTARIKEIYARHS